MPRTARTATGRDTTNWRQLLDTLTERLSLICRWVWSGVAHGRTAVAEEVRAAQQRQAHAELLAAAEEGFAQLVAAGLDPETTELDEVLEGARHSFAALEHTERRQAHALVLAIGDFTQARAHAAEVTQVLDARLHTPTRTA